MAGRGHRRQFAALPDLRLPPLEIFAQRLLQPFSPRPWRCENGSFVVVLSIGHHEFVHRVSREPESHLSSTHRPASLPRQTFWTAIGAAGTANPAVID